MNEKWVTVIYICYVTKRKPSFKTLVFVTANNELDTVSQLLRGRFVRLYSGYCKPPIPLRSALIGHIVRCGLVQLQICQFRIRIDGARESTKNMSEDDQRLLDSFEAAVTAANARLQAIGPEERSQRNLTYHRRNSTADMIKRYLQEDGHQIWGFVIYRCTYESDVEWEKFMEHMVDAVRFALQVHNGLDLLDNLEMTVISDRWTLDHASTSVVREQFKRWVETAPQQEQGTGRGPARSQRYSYCIQVDEIALRSVLTLGNSMDAFVNLVKKEWETDDLVGPDDPLESADPDEEPDYSDEEEEPLEGCTLHDVGWMKISYMSAMVTFYHLLRNPGEWYSEYWRPPQIGVA